LPQHLTLARVGVSEHRQRLVGMRGDYDGFSRRVQFGGGVTPNDFFPA
jgi:hypothetical protein